MKVFTVMSFLALATTATTAVEAAPMLCVPVLYDVALQPGGPANQRIYGELCARGGVQGKTIQVLVHGAGYDHKYWSWPYRPSTYSYTEFMTDEGYATLSIDRIGVGFSSKPADGAALDLHVAAYTVHQIVQKLRQGAPKKIELVGFSLGSFIATIEASTWNDVDGVVLTSYSHTVGPQGEASFGLAHPANEEWQFSHLPPSYLTTVPGSREGLFFHTPQTERVNLILDEFLKTTYTSGELGDIFPSLFASLGIVKPVLLLVGDYDLFSCLAPSCTASGSLAAEPQFFNPAACLEVEIVPNTGHSMNLHKTAQNAFERIHAWSDRRVGPRTNTAPTNPCQ